MAIGQEQEAGAVSYERFRELAPTAFSALSALGKAVDDSGLDKSLTELVKLRVTQINRCSFCIHFHLGIARRLGLPAAKLDLVAAWQDAAIYSQRERAALAWAEHLTSPAGFSGGEDARLRAQAAFSETELVHLTVAIAQINAWNRIAGGLGFAVPAGG